MTPKIRNLCEVYKDYFPIGAAVNPEVINTHRELLINHFNSITPENEMKFAAVHPEEGNYTFAQADLLVDFARENHLKVRGHTLIWHNQTPDWVFLDEYGQYVAKDILLRRMKEHITTVIKHFAGYVYCWDVVNEAIADDPHKYLRETKWLQIIGEEYLQKAFEFAHEADPNALLFYNDYNESDTIKSEKIYRLVKTLLDKGTPIHGIGLQAHWNIFSPKPDEIRMAIEKYASLGLKLQITELDVSVFRFDDHRADLKEPTREMLDKQAEFLAEVFSIFREYKDVITGVTFWGIADDSTWLDNFPVKNRKNWPLLFDVNHQPKKCFYAIINF